MGMQTYTHFVVDTVEIDQTMTAFISEIHGNVKKTEQNAQFASQWHLLCSLKGVLQPKLKMLSLITYPHVVPNP